MDFPHLNDTKFPIIDNVNVYKYQNNFDYARWQGKVSYKLLNVKWNNTYADVPYFDTLELRDTWFDSQEGQVGILESLFNNTPKNTLKIPLPYNDMYHYNYIVVDMPIQTSVDNPINYGNENLRVKRWFFFINDMQQFAPNTTQLEIEVDYWTTFIHSVDIPYLMLERGHAPMMQTTVEKFLDNPISNNEYLLANDFNYGGESIIKTSNYIPIGNGKKYVLFCAPFSKKSFERFDGSQYTGNSTPPTFADINNRWGYQLKVNDYEWKYGHTDYSNVGRNTIYNVVQTGLLNGCECFAIEGTYAEAFFNICAREHVNFIHGIQAMFILDGDLFDITDSFEFLGYTLYIADRKMNDYNFKLNKGLFGFDSKYANIAKLYTFPYSQLEITDDEGNTFSARVENCGNLQMHTEVSLVYPFLNYNVFFSGINGDGTMPYTWKAVYDIDIHKTMWASDFSKFMMNWNVPVYSLFIEAENEYAANNFFNNKARRAGAIKDYENAVRYANTTYENTDDSFTTNTANVGRTGATNTANVARTGSTMSTNQGVANAANTTVTSQNVTTSKANMQLNRTANSDINSYNVAKLSDDSVTDINTSQTIVSTTNTAATVTTANNNACNVATSSITAGTGVLSGMVSGGIAGGGVAALSGASNLVGTAMHASTASLNTAIAVTTDQGVTDALCNATAAKFNHAQTCMNNVTIKTNDTMRDTTNNACDAMTNNTITNNTANQTQVDNIVATNNTNATATQSTNNTNASATQTTETDNADYTRDATVAAEKANLIQKQLEVENTYKNARLQRPVKQGEYNGDFFGDVYMRRGVRFNVRTQPKSIIAQTGDAFLRFGYALHRVWDMSNGFHYCKNFTFWKAEDIWINDGTGVANVAVNTIANILLSGVTVWRDPKKIGTVGIYDNI